MRDYQESVTTGQTHNVRQSDTYVPLCFAGDTTKPNNELAFNAEFQSYFNDMCINDTGLSILQRWQTNVVFMSCTT